MSLLREKRFRIALKIFRCIPNFRRTAQPVIAQLVERRTVVGNQPVILRSAVRLRLAGKVSNFYFKN